MLRYLLRGKHPRDAAAAALALAELGDERDVAALVKASKRQHWPVPGAAAYSLARMAQRGALRPHAAARALCELGPLARAVRARQHRRRARRARRARPCEDRWARSAALARARARADRARRGRALDPRRGRGGKARRGSRRRARSRRCAATDVEPSVRAVCVAPEPAAAREPADIYAYAQDGTTLLRNRLVAVRLADGAVFLGYSDLNGHLRLASAPRGKLRLEQPELTAARSAVIRGRPMATMSIGAAIRWLAEQAPDATLITHEGASITRREFDLRTNRLARAYAARGVVQDAFVTIALPNGIEFYAACVATWKLGATPQPISAKLPAAERRAILELAKPALVVGVTRGRRLRAAERAAGLRARTRALRRAAARLHGDALEGADLGRQHRPAQADRRHAAGHAPTPSATRMRLTQLVPGPLYHNAPFTFSMRALFTGGHLVVMSALRRGAGAAR